MHLEIPHNMPGKDRALAKIKTALIQHRSELIKHITINEERWEGDSLHFAIELQGKKVSGTLTIAEKDFILDAKLPLVWRLFEKRIEAEIKNQVEALR